MKTFAEAIKRLEAEIDAIKAIKLRSSETLGTISKQLTISPKIHGVKYKNLDDTWSYFAFPDTKAVISIDTGGEACFAELYFISARNSRTFYREVHGDSNGDYVFEVLVYGNNADAIELNGETSNKKAIPTDISIICTSNFEATITYESV